MSSVGQRTAAWQHPSFARVASLDLFDSLTLRLLDSSALVLAPSLPLLSPPPRVPARVQSTPELRVVFAGDPLYDMLVLDALRDDAALALLSIVFVFLCAGLSVPF